jgi:hypothetical protein
MKLVGLVFLGLIASVIISSLAMWAIIKVFPTIGGDDTYLWVPFLITIPFGFFAGCIITGYFSYYDIENKWLLLWMSPVLYCGIIWMFISGVTFLLDSFAGVKETSHTNFWNGICIPFLMGLYWYLPSLAGVGLGYFIRKQFARWWYGD